MCAPPEGGRGDGDRFMNLTGGTEHRESLIALIKFHGRVEESHAKDRDMIWR